MEQSCDESTVTVTDEDMEVANIMLELPHLIFQSNSPHSFAFTTWLSKKKRSTSYKQKLLSAAPSPSPPSNAVASTYKTVGPMEKPLTSSPATPLAFSPSESDEKLKPQGPSKKKSYVNNLKKRKEQMLEIMEDFTRRNELLKKDMETKKRFHDQLKAENLELKAKKQKLYHNLRKLKAKDPCLETSKSLNLEIEVTTQISKETENNSSSCQFHQQPLMKEDQTVHRSATSKNGEYPIGGMICWLPRGTSKLKHDNMGPVGLFDLNVSAKEALFDPNVSAKEALFDLNVSAKEALFDMRTATKARAAEARFNRKQICKSKNYNAATYKARCLF